MSIFSVVIICYIIITDSNDAARILGVFPIPSISHQVVFRPLTQELAKRGHNVVVITTDPVYSQDLPPANLTEIDVHDVSYKIWEDKFMSLSKGNKQDLVLQMKGFFEAMIMLVDAQLKNEEVQNLIRNKSQTFDLILIEACVRPARIFSHIYNAPIILVSSLGAVLDNYAIVGAPLHPFLYPAITHQRLNNLTKWEKIEEFYNRYLINNLYDKMKISEYQMLKNHFNRSIPSTDELNGKVHMLLLNIHPVFEGIRPVPPNVIYMGGLHQKPEKALPEDLKKYLDSSKNGVIYLSFGTNVDPSLLPPEKIQIFVQTFSKLPYNVLWKWNKDELAGRTNNIKISKWLPQSDLLKHPNIKLFITQGGLQSTDEAITAGVPLIGIPMLGDQWFNVEKYVYHKIGIRLDIEELSEEKLTKAIKTIINDKSYYDNIITLRDVLNDQPQRPLERAVWWTEYVLRHRGALHLRSPAANISWFQYLELDIVFILLVVLFAVALLLILSVRLIYINSIRNYVKIKIA